ncbi:amidohydrolase family protein [Chitinophaga lutea]
MNRRNFVRNMTASASGVLLGAGLLQDAAAQPKYRGDREERMRTIMRYRKLDAHVHLGLSNDPPELNVDFAERLGIDRMYLSKPVTRGPGAPEDFRACNDVILAAMKKYPGRLGGMLTLNPQHPKESLEEIKRCLGEGMTGIKVYYQIKINDPLFYPIIEKSIEHKLIILMHAEASLGIGGYRMKYDQKIKPNTSRPEDFIEAAKRYPEAMLQYAHTGGGPDWEYSCKALAPYPNVYVDVSGSNNENNMVEFAVATLGVERVLFGSDNMYYQSVGKIIDARLTEEQKKKIFFDNYNNILKKGGHHVS